MMFILAPRLRYLNLMKGTLESPASIIRAYLRALLLFLIGIALLTSVSRPADRTESKFRAVHIVTEGLGRALGHVENRPIPDAPVLRAAGRTSTEK